MVMESDAVNGMHGNYAKPDDEPGKNFSRKKILIVDDNEINRAILAGILENTYVSFEAENGLEALKILEKNRDIALILLDINMPVMDGHEFLHQMKKNSSLIAIPVIVTTASNTVKDEVTCLGEGAVDFVTKPYNPEIVMHRIESIIRLCETSRLLSLLEYDRLTGVLSKEAFFQHASTEIQEHPENKYDVICCDISGFKVLKEMYGSEATDRLLCFVAELMKNIGDDEFVLCGRIDSDVFAVCRRETEKLTENFFDSFFARLFKESPVKSVRVKFGIYHEIDSSLPFERICSRALLAIEQIKNNKTKNIAFYMDWEKKQEFLNNFERALSQKQFKLFLQPKWDIISNCIGGAEALVRWIDDRNRLIPPGEFIPLFEEKGFITQLDFYMWEETCRLLHRWKKEGRKLFPISVNMSRMDINVPDLVERIKAMVLTYELPPEMIHFEILEEAYTENAEKLIDVCNQLREFGIKIEMDDFGIGNSSLNMLSILPIDYLKLDMKFQQTEDMSSKKSILSSIISLATWLELEAIAEGVEKKEQVDRLKNMGCRYVQGFYFSKPIPVPEFEEYVAKNTKAYENSEELSLDEKEKLKYEKFFSQKRCKVLIVEDMIQIREKLCKILVPYVDVVVAADGKQALEKLENLPDVDLVVLDLMLPELDGFQVFKRMKKNDRLKNIPVLITSENSRDTEIRAIKSGADGFLPKPHDVLLVLHHVRSVLIVRSIMTP